MNRRTLSILTGAVLAGAYLFAAAATFRSGYLPVRPIYEGFAPQQPYQWVNPPPDLAQTNVPPAPGGDRIPLTAQGNEASQVQTPDGQALVLIPANALVPRDGETHVRVSVVPQDPSAHGEPPDDLLYDGNAYEITATYENSGEPAQLRADDCPAGTSQCITVLLRYPFGASELLVREGDRWVPLDDATTLSSTLQIYADVTRLGVFVAAHTPDERAGGGAGNLIGFLAGLAAVLGGTLLAATRARRHDDSAKATERRTRGAKGPARTNAKRKVRSLKRWLRS